MSDEQILRVVRASDVDGPGDAWPCSWCGVREQVAEGWVIDHEDVIPGQAMRAFVCDRCARTATRRAEASAGAGQQRCCRCDVSCAEGQGAVIGRVDEVSPEQVLHVPLCRECAKSELARIRARPGDSAS
jgi:hypothetical protein